VQIQDLSSGACQAAGRNSTTGVIDTQNPVGVINANVGSVETRGVDLLISYLWELGFGIGGGSELSITFNATFLDKLNLTPIAGLDTINGCAGAYGRTCGEPKPETKTNTMINWTSGDLGLGLRYRWAEETRLDEVVFGQRPPDSVASLDIGGNGYVDLSFGYDINDAFTIWGGIINVFDEDPPLLGRRQVRANTSPDTFSPTGTELFVGGSYGF
jgi:outer membrane receptor protein involved in Fe transport